MRSITLLFICVIALSCKNPILPKPKAYLGLAYAEKYYKTIDLKRPYTFEVLKSTTLINKPNNWLSIKYSKLKASIDITYRPVENNLKELLFEAEKLVYKHTIKADKIIPKSYINYNKKAFASVYEITGNAASNLQFHITDSTTNFIKGALYFYAKPNYDSLIPAIHYIKKDIIHLIETLEWKN